MFFKKKQNTFPVKERSNIIQFDNLGYLLILCIMADGSQRWIDVNEEWVSQEIDKGNLHIIEWVKLN